MKLIQILSISSSVLFSHTVEDNTIKLTVEAAVAASVNLEGAHLEGAHLEGARLEGAYLTGAHLEGAYLIGARLTRAHLEGAHLEGARLEGAYLEGAYLEGAKITKNDVVAGKRPIFQIGPIGSRESYFVAVRTEKRIILKTGCFTGSIEEFREKLKEEHGNNPHAQEYNDALIMIQTHMDLWAKE